MDQIYPDDGLPYTLAELVNGNLGAGLQWCLYTNNVVPSLNDNLATYVLAAAWGRQFVPAANFPGATVVAHVASTQAPNITFTNNTGGPVDVYGYVILDQTSAKVVAAARFDGALPITVPNLGNIQVTPIIGDYSALAS